MTDTFEIPLPPKAFFTRWTLAAFLLGMVFYGLLSAVLIQGW